MDIDKLIKNVKNLNDYMAVTEDVNYKYKLSKVQINMSTVLSLKKVKALEIEYFNKCDGNGAAFTIIERLLGLPPSKTWGLLGKELVSLLQYWLDAIRKHLITHTSRWWTFLSFILKVVKDMRLKDTLLPDILVEGVSERLLDLATRKEPDNQQRLEILHSLNMCCADSSREVRFVLRHHLENYFVKLSLLLVKTGHLPTQYSMLETLLRWLLPRQNTAVRQTATEKWFPENLYGKKAICLFLERAWQNFPQDARDFLNACNEIDDLVTSAVCRKLIIGDIVVVSGTEKLDKWFDVNSVTKCISVLLDPRMLEALGVGDQAAVEALIISLDIVDNVQLCRESAEVKIVMKTVGALHLCYSTKVVGNGDVIITVSSRSDLKRLDKALRRIFDDKYQVLLDLSVVTILSPRGKFDAKYTNSSEEDTRLSHPVHVQRRKHSGCIVRSKVTGSLKSPSTTSTTSLALLHDRLAALPKYNFDKEPVKVSLLPELSSVTELSEVEDRQSLASQSTYKYRSYAVCHKKFRFSEKNSQSDGERNKPRKYMSPVNEHPTSCLLVATVGSDESVINDTLERLSKSKDYKTDNIVDLLVKEALQSKEDKLLDSGINIDNNQRTSVRDLQADDTEVVENTLHLQDNIDSPKVQENHNKVTISEYSKKNTTFEESNVIDGTQFEYVNVRKRSCKITNENVEKKHYDVASDMPVYDQEAIEQFFSQHIAEDKRGDIVVSPTLARKINETSSESSQYEESLLLHNNFLNADDINDAEIIDCLNSILDDVCNDFEKCAKIMDRVEFEIDTIAVMNKDTEANQQKFEEIANVDNDFKNSKTPAKPEKNRSKKKNTLKIKFNTKKSLDRSRAKKQNLNLDIASKMPPIPEVRETMELENPEIKETDEIQAQEVVPQQKQISSPEISNINVSPKASDLDTPLVRRKRKLYSPKNDYIGKQKAAAFISDIEQNNNNSEFKVDNKQKTSKFNVTPYKEIEKERKKKIRPRRTRKSNAKARTPSPRTKKMNELFDKLKENVQKNENIILADKKSIENDLAVYNFTSDSEDEDFQKKKIEMHKRNSSTTIASGDSALSTRRGKLVNYPENIKDSKKSKKPTKRNARSKKTRSKTYNLADEKMREAPPEVLNTSLVIEKPISKNKDLQLVLEHKPQMDMINDEENDIIDTSRPKGNGRKHIKKEMTIKNKMESYVEAKDKAENEDRTLSPLPGLIVETVPPPPEDPNDSVSSQMMVKLKKIYNGENIIEESNTTQNLLLGMEKVDENANNFNVTAEIHDFNLSDSKGDTNVKPKTKVRKIKKEMEVTCDNNNKNIGRDTWTYLKKEVSDNIEIINISCNTDSKSEKSIATVGNSPITAHGDQNELPPSSKLLTQKVSPRNLELEDLDQSTKEYYVKLRNEIFVSRRSSNSRSSQSNNIDDNLLDKKSLGRESAPSPVVSLTRLSYDDISKWLPSRRNSESDSSIRSTLKSTSNNEGSKQNDHKSTRSVKSCSRRSSYYKLSNSPKLNDQKVLEVKTLNRNTDVQNKKDNKTMNRSISPIEKVIINDFDTAQNRNGVNQRASIISPVKMFDEVFKTTNTYNNVLKKSEAVSIKQPKAKPKRYELRSHKQDSFSSESKISTSTRVDNTKTSIRSVFKGKSATPGNISIESKTSTSNNVDNSKKDELKSVYKRKSTSPIDIDEIVKIKKIETVSSESGPSVSSVNDWFRRNATVSEVESVNLSIKDSLEQVMEKLDTTLVEIHQSTSKRFVHMFVEAQRHLSEMKADRHRMYKQVTKDILLSVMDRLADLEKRSQEMDSEFMEQLKSRAADLVREDCKQKHAMVVLLKEDLQAVMDRMTKRKKDHK